MPKHSTKLAVAGFSSRFPGFAKFDHFVNILAAKRDLDDKLTACPIPSPLRGLLNPPHSTENRNPDGQVKKLHVAPDEI